MMTITITTMIIIIIIIIIKIMTIITINILSDRTYTTSHKTNKATQPNTKNHYKLLPKNKQKLKKGTKIPHPSHPNIRQESHKNPYETT